MKNDLPFQGRYSLLIHCLNIYQNSQKQSRPQLRCPALLCIAPGHSVGQRWFWHKQGITHFKKNRVIRRRKSQELLETILIKGVKKHLNNVEVYIFFYLFIHLLNGCRDYLMFLFMQDLLHVGQ